MAKKRTCCFACLLAVGIVLLIGGGVFYKVGPDIIHNEIEKQVNLHEDTEYDNWVKNPIPIYFQVWVWDVTNPEEVMNGAKPAIEQKGPYTYSEWRRKANITFHDNNGTVSYMEHQFFKFEKDMSNGNLENDTFTTVNIPMMTIASLIQREFSWIKTAVQFFLNMADEEVFVTLKVSDILWGYEDALLKKFEDYIKEFHIPFSLDDHFGLFYQKNGSTDGLYNIFSGAAGTTDRFGQIDTWNYQQNLTYWTTASCNRINGSDGTAFPPFTTKSDTLYVFSTDLCRSIYFKYTEDVKLKGIDLYRFVVPPRVFANHTVNPDNEGYCTPECYGSGVLNVGACRSGAPVFLSQPHFLAADPKYIHGVDGVHPNTEEHQTVIDLEPNTGAAFNAQKKLQLNVKFENVPGLTQTQKLINNTILPILWLNESATLTDSLANEFKSALMTPKEAMSYGTYAVIGLGAALILVAVIALVMIKACTGPKSYSTLVDDPSPPSRM